MKRELSSFDIMILLRELRGSIISSLIDNIYQINENTILLKLRKKGEPPLWMVLEAGKRFNLTAYSLQRPKKPTQFCMALRKYLRGGRIENVEQHEFERILKLSVENRSEKFHLICEFFRNGNIILTDSEFKILHALYYRRMRDRNVIRGEKLAFPPSSGFNPLKIDLEKLKEIRNLSDTQIVRALTKFLSIGGLYAEEILRLAEIDKKKLVKNLSDEDLQKIYCAIQHLIESAERAVKPQIVIDEEGKPIDVVPFELTKYRDSRKVYLKLFNEAVDKFYTEFYVKGVSEEISERIEKELAKYEAILRGQVESQKSIQKEIDRSRRIGDIIYSHLNELTHLKRVVEENKDRGLKLDEIASILNSEKKAERIPYVYFEGFNPEKGEMKVTLNGEKFQISISDSIYKDAEKYYQRAKTLEKKLEGLKKAIREMEERTRKLREKGEIEKSKSLKVKPIRKQKWYEKFRWFHSSEGFLIIGGRDAATNDILIKKYMEPKDIVLHAEVAGAPFVLIKTHGEEPTPETLREAAIFAASYSKAWREGLSSVDVYWVKPDQVSWSPPSGQYLRRGSFIIKGERNYLREVPLKIAIGVVKNEELHVIGGPREAVSKRALCFVEIKPGRIKSGSLAKKVREKLSKLTEPEVAKSIMEIPIEEIQRFIPPGGGELS
ncbi:NFACT family protein [Candidatus Bathyarchaeota archaeon]|nr:NFACT family protein [Candidatus Bathyarchaeota archaeon]